jgi:hypothetical protein
VSKSIALRLNHHAYMLSSIALQLEHLAFTKAAAYYYNHHRQGVLRKKTTQLSQPAPLTARNVTTEGLRSLVVVLRLHTDRLYSIQDKYPSTAPSKIVEVEPTSAYKHNKLRLLLNGEFCDHRYSHSNLKNAAAMWKKSQELDETLSSIWQSEKERIQQELGKQEYRDIGEVLKAWLVICRMARSLGELTGRHPLEGKPVPRRTFEQWVDKLGGVSEYGEMDYELTQYRMELETFQIYGDNPDEVAEKLTKAFATVTKYPNAVKVFKSGVVRFNEKLFSWGLEF